MYAGKLQGSEDVSDQERDANSLLLEMDKGLRSQKPGEQCEAIVRFPRLFEKYPFPILINSAFLKLADLFRVGSNFLRHCILKVTQQSQKHLVKIPNVDEFLRRIYAVMHSNDPVARAIALRTLGLSACIIAERKNVQHSIINGLDSHDAVEQEAAIFAASCFAEQSKSFAAIMCTKLEVLTEDLVTPVGIKLKLIPIFQHMHHEAAVARKVIDLCTRVLLPCYPSRDFTVITLHTMSLLSAKSLLDVPKQIDLLLDYLQTDCRRVVKIVAIQDLLLIAKHSPHVWTSEHIHVLCNTGIATNYSGLKLGLLKVLTELSGSLSVTKFSTDPNFEVMELCSKCCYEDNLLVASYGAMLLTHLAIKKQKLEGVTDLAEECSAVLDMLIILTAEKEKKHFDEARLMCMSSVVTLCKACPSLTEHFVDTLMSNIATEHGQNCLPLCHCLAALGSQSRSVMPALVPELLTASVSFVEGNDNPEDKTLVLPLITLLFQATVEDHITEEVETIIKSILQKVDSWTAYKVGRQAARYGHHAMAAIIFKRLVNLVSSEHNNFWLTALKECCQAETYLIDSVLNSKVSNFVKQASQAEMHYHNAVSALKAASLPGRQLEFQISYLQNKAEMLQVFMQIVQVCSSFQTSPPPAIATSLAMTTGQDFHRCRHVVVQLKACRKRIESLNEAYEDLYKVSFDADATSLKNIRMLQESCQLLIHVLDTVFVLCRRESSPTPPDNLPQWKASHKHLPLEYHKWGSICQQVLELLELTVPTPCQATLTHHHVHFILKSVMLVCSSRLVMPRYFFQKLQDTNIKLAISPQLKTANDPISISYDTNLTLKVEGIVLHGKKPGLHRQVKKVKLSVSSTQQSKGPTTSEEKVKENPTNDMTQTTVPLNDYFTANLLLTFPVPGLHTVQLCTTVEDEIGATWIMGSKVTIMVKSFDEAVSRQQQQQYAAQRQQQRAALVSAISSTS